MNRHHIQTVEWFREWYVRFDGNSVHSIDFETTSLNYLEMEFVGFSICNGKHAIYVDNPDCLPLLSEILKHSKWIMHNAVYDLKCCQKFMGVTPDVVCTLTAAKLINENRQSYSLKNLAHEDLGVSKKDIKKYDEVAYSWSSPEFVKYAQNDAIWTYQLWKKYEPLLHKEKQDYVFYNVEMPFQVVLRDLESLWHKS